MARTPRRVNAPKSAIAKADASSRRRTAAGGETIHVLRWARWTNAEDFDNEKIYETDWCADANSWSEISQCIKDDLEANVPDGMCTAGAYRSRADAIAARDELMRSKIAEARKDVMGALGMSSAHWKQNVEAKWIVEFSDQKIFGVEHVGPDKRYRQIDGRSVRVSHDVVEAWTRGSDSGRVAPPVFSFKDAKHNKLLADQTHYELVWGSLDGCPTGNPAVESDAIKLCTEIYTRLRCWIEPVNLVA